MSSLAQEESRSISENTTWGKRKQFAEGKTSVGYSAFLGYDKDFKINEEQAKVVKLIYKFFLGGRSFYAITKELEKRGHQIPVGKGQVVHLHGTFHSYQREVPWRCTDPERVYGRLSR